MPFSQYQGVFMHFKEKTKRSDSSVQIIRLINYIEEFELIRRWKYQNLRLWLFLWLDKHSSSYTDMTWPVYYTWLRQSLPKYTQTPSSLCQMRLIIPSIINRSLSNMIANALFMLFMPKHTVCHCNEFICLPPHPPSHFQKQYHLLLLQDRVISSLISAHLPHAV